jgi:hypothetical protein
MQKSRVYVTQAVNVVMPTRFWASYNDKNSLTCENYIKDLGLNATDTATFCKKFDLGDVKNLGNISTLVMASQGNATAKDEIMNGFWDPINKQGFNITEGQFADLYNAATAGSIGNTIAAIYALAASTFNCSGATCTFEELFTMQQN